MREQQLETIHIKDVDGDIDDGTVMRFIEYAYTGDYTTPDPDIVQLPTDPRELQEAFETKSSLLPEDEWGISKKSKKDKKTKRSTGVIDWGLASPVEEPVTELQEDESERDSDMVAAGPTLRTTRSDRRRLWDSFSAKSYTIYRSSWLPRDSNDEREDYSGVFLCHTRLYKFSDRYGCSKLKKLTLQKLRLTLCKYKLHPQRTSDIVELIRYTYTHTMDRITGRDELRALVLEFAVCYFRELVEQTAFLQLLQEGRPLPADFLTEAARLVS